ncbi:MAG: HAMP domain-containing histidine kinase [Clostridia bacterium]|nr:HAMP domain-containing histidine kinase [Clostridia bacterium]
MFRSIFTKYISVFMLTIIVSFIVQISIISTLIGSYSDTSKEVSLSRAADTVAEYINENVTGASSVSEYIDENGDTLSDSIRLLLDYAGDVSVVISDIDGNVLYTAGKYVPAVGGSETYEVSADLLSNVTSSGYSFVSEDSEGIFASVKYVCGRAISSDGTVVGAVFTCSSKSNTDSLLNSLVSSTVLASLWVMLAALVAVYFLSERVVRPIRDISAAAKRFAAGDFDVRVNVVGKDEIAELAETFNNMAASLADLENMRSTFLANVSHDLRTPMTTISGYIDGILDGAIPPDKYEHYLKIVKNEVGRLSRLVSSLLDLTRIEAGVRKFTFVDFDICEMAREIIISMEARLTEKDLKVEFDSGSDNIFVTADRDAIYQVLYNICDNAVKFSREGGEYKVSASVYGKKVHVSVFNEGQGIPEEDIAHVFDRFYKSDKSRGLDKTGVGLGLYICKTIIDAHGETIAVNSEYGKYCEFSFTLTPKK